MERFTLQKGTVGDGQWVCVDNVNGLICAFEQGKFADTQIFSLQYDIKQPDIYVYAKVRQEMEDWLKKNHPEKL